jgi:hypothetical protein
MTRRTVDLSSISDAIQRVSRVVTPKQLRNILVKAMSRTTRAWKEESDKYIDHGPGQKFRRSIRTTSEISPGGVVAFSRSGHPLAHLIEDGTTDRWRGPDKDTIASAVLRGDAKLPQGKWYTGRMPAYKLLEKAINRTKGDVIADVDKAIRKQITNAIKG